jgi:hypothetical protein
VIGGLLLLCRGAIVLLVQGARLVASRPKLDADAMPPRVTIDSGELEGIA